jgi:hypothetical protein
MPAEQVFLDLPDLRIALVGDTDSRLIPGLEQEGRLPLLDGLNRHGIGSRHDAAGLGTPDAFLLLRKKGGGSCREEGEQDERFSSLHGVILLGGARLTVGFGYSIRMTRTRNGSRRRDALSG